MLVNGNRYKTRSTMLTCRVAASSVKSMEEAAKEKQVSVSEVVRDCLYREFPPDLGGNEYE